MLDEATPLPDDPDDLRDLASRLIAEVKAQAILIHCPAGDREAICREGEKLRHQLAGHRAHRFGASAETAEQLQLALETSELAAAAMIAKLRLPDVEETAKDKSKRRPLPDHVPRMEIELSPTRDDCASCGGMLRRIGEDGEAQQATVRWTVAPPNEELEYGETDQQTIRGIVCPPNGRFVVNRIVRPRFACAPRGDHPPEVFRSLLACERFTQSPLPSRPIERGRPGPGLLAHVLVSKYGNHLPLYRQSQIFERDGIDLDRSTLAEWVGKSTALLEPLAEAIGRHVLDDAAIRRNIKAWSDRSHFGMRLKEPFQNVRTALPRKSYEDYRNRCQDQPEQQASFAPSSLISTTTLSEQEKRNPSAVIAFPRLRLRCANYVQDFNITL